MFSAGCTAWETTIDLVKGSAYPSCEVEVLDMRDEAVSERAREMGVRSIPAAEIASRIMLGMDPGSLLV